MCLEEITVICVSSLGTGYLQLPSQFSSLHCLTLCWDSLVPGGVGDGGFSAKYAHSRQLTVHHNFVESSLIQIMTFLENPEQLIKNVRT